MTVSTSTNRNDYAGNGSTTSFAVSFRFLENSHIKATLRDALSTETIQVETTDYTLTGAGGAGGGTLVMIVAPPSGTTLTIQRDVPATQETDYVENDEFPAESHEDALDKLTMLVQQQGEDSTRHIGFSDTVSDATGSAVELSQDATQRADKFLGFDAAGNIVTKTASVAGLVDQDQQDKRYGPTFTTVAALTAANPVSIDGVVVNLVAGLPVKILDYATGRDSGMLEGTIVAGATGTADGGAYIDMANGTQFEQIFKVDGVNVKQFGAVGDAVTDDSVQIQAAVDFSSAGDTIRFSEGSFFIGTTITISKWLSFEGETISNSIFTNATIRSAGGITAFTINTETMVIKKIAFVNDDPLIAGSIAINIKQIAGATIRPIFDIRFEEVWIANYTSYGIYAPTGMYGAIIEKCTFEGNEKSISINYDEEIITESSQSFNKIANCVFFINKLDIEIEGRSASFGASVNTANIISNNSFFRNNGETFCVIIDGKVKGTVVDGNTFAQCQSGGVSSTNTKGTMVNNNTFDFMGRQAIAIVNDPSFSASNNPMMFINMRKVNASPFLDFPQAPHGEEHSGLEITGSKGVAIGNSVTVDNPVELFNQYGVFCSASTVDIGNVDLMDSTTGLEFLSTAASKVTFSKSGTFVPTVVGSSTPGTPSYTVQEGTFTVSDSTCTFSIVVAGAKDGAATGDLRIMGFPTTPLSGLAPAVASSLVQIMPAANSITLNTATQVVVEKLPTVDYLRVIEFATATFTLVPVTALGTNFTLTLRGSYIL